jgi:hypothetical protein
VAGHVGAEICRRCLELGWLARQRDTRALRLTPAGIAGLGATFGLDLRDRTGVAQSADAVSPGTTVVAA